MAGCEEECTDSLPTNLGVKIKGGNMEGDEVQLSSTEPIIIDSEAVGGGQEIPKLKVKKKRAKYPALNGKKKIDWDAVQSDRDAGIPVLKLVKKYKVSNFTIYMNTHSPKQRKSMVVRHKKPVIAASPISSVLKILCRDRDELNLLIDGLQKVQARKK
jgi:hypothetical protein